MAVLSDKSIRKRLADGDLVVDPLDLEDQLQPGSLDIRLGDQLLNKHTGEQTTGKELTLEPNTFYLAHTKERFEIPTDITAQVSGRSSIGRKGVMIHITAGLIDAGFEGDITLEVYNVDNDPVTLHAGDRIGQLIFFRMDDHAAIPYGEKADAKYHGQAGPTNSRFEN